MGNKQAETTLADLRGALEMKRCIIDDCHSRCWHVCDFNAKWPSHLRWSIGGLWRENHVNHRVVYVRHTSTVDSENHFIVSNWSLHSIIHPELYMTRLNIGDHEEWKISKLSTTCCFIIGNLYIVRTTSTWNCYFLQLLESKLRELLSLVYAIWAIVHSKIKKIALEVQEPALDTL